MRSEVIEDMGDKVICDICNKDYTNSDEQGGFIFSSYAYCPDCAKKRLPLIKSYGEEKYIKAWCPEGMSFKNFVIAYRGNNNKITLITPEEGEDFFDILRRNRRLK